MNTKIWLCPPHMNGSEEKYIREAFETNWIAPLGPNVEAFEKLLSDYMEGCHVAALNSGTSAIHLALMLLDVQAGDEVIAPDFTFAATINPILYLGAVPVFVDSSMQTWNMDPVLLEEAILQRIRTSGKPKAVIYVDIYGMPANIDAFREISLRYDIPLIEDAAEALGSKYNGRPCGTFGRMGIISFNGNKIITTSAGGALISTCKEDIEKAKFLSSQARENTLHFEHPRVGFNYRMSNVLAGIGRGQMEVLEERIAAHRRINRQYRELLSCIPELIFQSEPDESYFSNFWLTSFIIAQPRDDFNASLLIEALGKDNIDSRPLMKPMHLQPFLKHFPAHLNGNSRYLYENGLCVPSGSGLSGEDVERIAGIISSVRGI